MRDCVIFSGSLNFWGVNVAYRRHTHSSCGGHQRVVLRSPSGLRGFAPNVGCAVRTKCLESLEYGGVFGAHGAPYRYFSGSLKNVPPKNSPNKTRESSI
ncbi:hypothetical protein [Alysiella crassa]|uniref:hypothetical protein n=1 Tax=Alysiella crassa TaxID=153491 RepID=UPI000E206103|nr:hypothetical protein [Alysiella crassa]